MKIAIKYDDVLIDQGGKIAGHEAADTLVRQLLRIFPGSIVIDAARRADGFDGTPLEMLDLSDVVSSTWISPTRRACGESFARVTASKRR